MTKMKKLFAVVLALAMLFTMASFSASAVDTAVTMTATAVSASEISVVIDASEDIGGLTATLTYDKDAVKYVGISGVSASNEENNTVKDDNGAIKIVLLGGDITVNFERISAAAQVTFELDDVTASDIDGTELFNLDVAPQTLEFNAITAEGNTIRDTSNVVKQDLGFVSSIVGGVIPENATDVKLGFVALPKSMLGSAELNLDAVETLGAIKTEVAINLADIAGEDSTEFVAHIAGIANNPTRMGRIISGRFYVSYKLNGVDQIVYSSNTKEETKVANGVVSKSHVSTCKAMAREILAKETDDSKIKYDTTKGSLIADRTAVEAIIGNKTTDDDQRLAILKFVADNSGILKSE